LVLSELSVLFSEKWGSRETAGLFQSQDWKSLHSYDDQDHENSISKWPANNQEKDRIWDLILITRD